MLCVDETATLDSGAGAVAVQISEVPGCPFARRTRRHARPAPPMVSVCPPDIGPSDAAKTTRSSFGDDVLNARVVTRPPPSAETSGVAVIAAAAVEGCASAPAATIAAQNRAGTERARRPI